MCWFEGFGKSPERPYVIGSLGSSLPVGLMPSHHLSFEEERYIITYGVENSSLHKQLTLKILVAH